MKYLSILFLTCISLGMMSFSATGDLTIRVENIQEYEGTIQIGLFNSAETFPLDDEAYSTAVIDVDGPTAEYVFEDLPAGNYAVAIFHDTNGNQEIEKNFFGIPQEAYGFSQNFKPTIKAPNFDQTDFRLEDDLTITINLIQ